MAESSLIFVLDAQLPFVRHPESPDCVEEAVFFNAISSTYLPLLRSCTALETEGIPFRLAIAFSPALCEMFADPLLQSRYVDTLDRSIEFALSELDRCADSQANRELVKAHLDQLQLNRRDFVEIYEKNILRKFDYFASRGYLEILATAATACFFPLYADIPEAINAQIETGLVTYRKHFTTSPAGFWLPALGFTPGLENILKAYGFQYTIVEGHGLLFASPPAEHGIFGPSWCPNGFIAYGRSRAAEQTITSAENGYMYRPEFLDTDRDIGFELDEKALLPLFDVARGRRITGFQYHAWGSGVRAEQPFYSISAAHAQLVECAADFLESRGGQLVKASQALEGAPVSLVCAFPAALLGQQWFEGVLWLETLYRQAALRTDITFATFNPPKLPPANAQRTVPFFSSWLPDGYADEMLTNANDWMYPYIRKATLRMIDLAERFPDDTGLKERALNMAAREILLAQSSDWPLLMREGSDIEYGRRRFEESVRAFTVVYESLGSNFISTEWLTGMEKIHNLFQDINYRVFRKRK